MSLEEDMGLSTKLLAAAVAAMMAGCAGQPAQVAQKAPAKKECLRETGTHIKTKEGECAPVDGRVYTDEDLRRSGATTLNEAINRLGR